MNNTIKLYGKVIKKTKDKESSLILNVVLALPINLKIYNEGICEQEDN